ncbi:MAG: DinB family protein [Janthinobacterium lividum]
MSEETGKARPYVHLVEGLDPVEIMQGASAALRTIVDRLGPEAVDRKPAPEKWSVREILCHIADCEVAWAWRLRLIYGSDHPELQPFEQDPWARAYVGPQHTAEAALVAFTALRTWNLAFIQSFTEADKQRTAHHPEIGDLTLWTVVEIAAGHDLHHLQSMGKL